MEHKREKLENFILLSSLHSSVSGYVPENLRVRQHLPQASALRGFLGFSLCCFRPRGGNGFLLSLTSGYLPEGFLNFSYTFIKCNPAKVSSVESPDTGTLKEISVLDPALPLMSWRRLNKSLLSGPQHTSKQGRKDRWLSKSYLPWRFWNPLENETGWCPVSTESLWHICLQMILLRES